MGYFQYRTAWRLSFAHEHSWFERIWGMVHSPLYALRSLLLDYVYGVDGHSPLWNDQFLLFIGYWVLIAVGIGLLLRPLWRKLLPPDENP